MRRSWKAMRAAADAVIDLSVAAGAMQEAGRYRQTAATLRWKAARRALLAMAAARAAMGLPCQEQLNAMTALKREAFLQ